MGQNKWTSLQKITLETIFNTIFNMALNLDIDLKENLQCFTETFKYLLQTSAAVLEIDMGHIMKFLIEFDPLKFV